MPYGWVVRQDGIKNAYFGVVFRQWLEKKDMVIKPVNPLVLFGIPWNAGMEAEVTVILYVDGAPVVSGGTFFCMGQESMRPHFSGQRYLCASFMGLLPHGHILCPTGQRGCPVL